MKRHPEFRSGRKALVIAINGGLIGMRLLFFGPLSPFDLFWIGVPLAGIGAEILGARAARWVNVGLYAVVAGLIIVLVLLASFKLFGFGEPEHLAPALWLVGFPCAIVALFLNWLYRVTATPVSAGGGVA